MGRGAKFERAPPKHIPYQTHGARAIHRCQDYHAAMPEISPQTGAPRCAPQPSVRQLLLRLVVAAICGFGLQWMGLPDAFSPVGQGDFEAPYYALKVRDAGGNPWRHEDVVKAAGKSVQHLMYPPHALAFFRMFDFEDVKKAKDVFLATKMACLAALLILWTTCFVAPGGRGWFMAFAALGFSGTICRDLVVGNQSILEQTLIWFGIFALLRGRLGLFCALIILCGQLKVLPLALLGLVLLTDSRHRGWYFLGSIAACLLIAVAVYWWDPEGSREFVDLMSRVAFMEPGGPIHPCSRLLIRDVTEWALRYFTELSERPDIERWALPAYGFFALGTLVLFIRAVWQRRDLKTAVYLALLTYTLVAPRMKDYSYILVLVPTFELIRDRLVRGGSIRWLVVGVVAALTLPGLDVFWKYRSLMLVAWVWATTLLASRAVPGPGGSADHSSPPRTFP